MKNVFKCLLFTLVLILSAAFVSAGANPVLNAISDQTVNEGQVLKVSLASTANDTVGGTTFKACLLASATASCAGTTGSIAVGTTTANISTLSNTAGEFNWTSDFTQAGVFFFNISATDGDSTSNNVLKVTVVDVPPKITATELALGGDTQERSDPNHDTQDKREVNLTGTITVKNEGTEQISNLDASVTLGSGFSANDLNLNYTFPKKTLASGESISVPVIVRVPQKLDAVNRQLQRISPAVATLNFKGTSATGITVTGASAITLKAEDNLHIKDVKVRFDGKSETVDDGDKVENMKAGQHVEFEIELENKFKDKEDVTIEDINVKVVSDPELDIDEDDDVGDLGPEDKDTIKLEGDIDEDADDGTFDVDISVEGTDEFGARHGETIRIRFEVKRVSHEIEIKSLILNPASVTCEKETTLTAHIRNSGKRDEDEAYVHIEAPELNYGKISDKMSLDKDDETSINFNIPVSESIKPGTYHVNIGTYYNTGTVSKTDTATLSVAPCKPVQETTAPVTEKPVATTQPVTVVTTPAPEQPKATTPPAPAKKSFLETPQYVALLVLAYVVVLGGGAALLLKLVRKP